MSTNFILVDYENEQPEFDALKGTELPFQLIIFFGASQNKIPLALATSVQSFGERAKYIQIASSGKNALDFHIAFHLGALVQRHSDGNFHIIAKDRGYDALVRHLQDQGINAHRWKSLEDMPGLSGAKKATPTAAAPAPASGKQGKQTTGQTTREDQLYAGFIDYLSGAGRGKPRKRGTLANSVKSRFGAGAVDRVMARMYKEGVTRFDSKQTVIYRFK